MTTLALSTGAINLGQGFPDEDGPVEIKEAAQAAIAAGANQYAPGKGILPLREAIAVHQQRFYGLAPDPQTEIIVTTGATEAIAASLLALVGPGDEVLTFEPFYDSYGAIIGLAGATHVTAPLLAPDFMPDLAALEAAFSNRTKVVLINNPHNPTGAVFPREVLERVVELAAKYDAVIVTDEVYEHLTFGVRHIPVATLPGAAERTLTISSAGKTFSFTGWKIGWLSGPEELVAAARTVKQFLSYSSGTPFQAAIAVGLGAAGRVLRRHCRHPPVQARHPQRGTPRGRPRRPDAAGDLLRQRGHLTAGDHRFRGAGPPAARPSWASPRSRCRSSATPRAPSAPAACCASRSASSCTCWRRPPSGWRPCATGCEWRSSNPGPRGSCGPPGSTP